MKQTLLSIFAIFSLAINSFAQNVSIGTPTSYGTSYDVAITLTYPTALSTWELKIEQLNGVVNGISYIQIAGATVTTAPYVSTSGNQITINNSGLGYGAISAGGSVVVNCRILSTEASPTVDWIYFPDAGSTNGGGSAGNIIANDQIWNNGGYDNFAQLNDEINDLRIASKTQIGSFYNGAIPYSLSVLFPESNIISCSESVNKRSVFWAKNYSYAYGFGIGDDNKGHIFQNFNAISSVMTFENNNVIVDDGTFTVRSNVGFGADPVSSIGLRIKGTNPTGFCIDHEVTSPNNYAFKTITKNDETKAIAVFDKLDNERFTVMGDGFTTITANRNLGGDVLQLRYPSLVNNRSHYMYFANRFFTGAPTEMYSTIGAYSDTPGATSPEGPQPLILQAQYLTSNLGVGFHATAPTSKLSVMGTTFISDLLTLNSGLSVNGVTELKTVNSNKILFVNNSTIGHDVFRVMGDGKMYATEVNVKLAGSFPDYVFDTSYDLMPLDSLREYIVRNKHLPNTPTATEVENQGVDLGELARIQQEKIEELTLYLIEQNEKMMLLAKKIEELEAKLQ